MNGKEFKDYYKILGVDKGASQDEIKKAYRKLAKEWHPDRHKEDKDKDKARQRFKEINEANQILGDPEKRKQYETFGQYVGEHGMPGGVNFEDLFEQGFNMGGASNIDDIFDLFTSGFGGQTRPRQTRGEDLHYRLKVSFTDSIKGVATKLSLRVNEPCVTCKGTGAKPGTNTITCPTCQGRGVTAQSQGFFSISHTCSRCLGKGTIIETPCSACKSTGIVNKSKQITIQIPAGVENGQTIRFKGKGQAAPNKGIPGDLYITVDVQKHPVFARDRSNLYMNLPITISEASLGAKVGVPTLNGKLTLKIPSGTISGKTFKLRGKGVPSRFGKGDMFVKVFIIPPKRMTKKEKELLKKLSEEEKAKPRDELFNIVNKVK